MNATTRGKVKARAARALIARHRDEYRRLFFLAAVAEAGVAVAVRTEADLLAALATGQPFYAEARS